MALNFKNTQVQEEKVKTQKAIEKVEQSIAAGVTKEEVVTEVVVSVDRYTQILAFFEQHHIDGLMKEAEELKKKLQEYARMDQYPSDNKIQFHGSHGNFVEFSAQANSTKITDKVGLIGAIGPEKYMNYADITLGNAKKLLTESELEKFTSTVPGARTIKKVHFGE